MSEDKSIIDKYSGILPFYRIAGSFLAPLAIACGLQYSLYSIVQFGILQLFITAVISLILQIKKLEAEAAAHKNTPTMELNEISEKPNQHQMGKRVSPCEMLRNFEILTTHWP